MGISAAAADFAASIGRVARRIREDLGLTLANVAEQAHISPGMLSRLETGRVSPSLETIVALAEVLGVRPALLLQEVGDEEALSWDGQVLEVNEDRQRAVGVGHAHPLSRARKGGHNAGPGRAAAGECSTRPGRTKTGPFSPV